MLSLKLTVRFAEARFFLSANLQYTKTYLSDRKFHFQRNYFISGSRARRSLVVCRGLGVSRGV